MLTQVKVDVLQSPFVFVRLSKDCDLLCVWNEIRLNCNGISYNGVIERTYPKM